MNHVTSCFTSCLHIVGATLGDMFLPRSSGFMGSAAGSEAAMELQFGPQTPEEMHHEQSYSGNMYKAQ